MDDTDAKIKAIESAGAPTKRHLEQIEARERSLHDASDPHGTGSSIDDLSRRELAGIESLLDPQHTGAMGTGPASPS